ncbi:thioredoxin domain-containing protein 15 [Euwallacea fornicatus]|uniref:thioredoxin domain-containing protein 15 n=1 Tax=Euwallacea fornicatus TaxID=995702 RepID=UPI00338FBA93
MQVFTLICLLSVGHGSAIEETNQEITEEVEQADSQNLEPIFEDIQPEFSVFPENAVSLLNSSSGSIPSNVTIEDFNNSTNTNSSNVRQVNCLKGGNITAVQLVNDTELIKLLVRDPEVASDKNSPGQCIVVLFYSKNCPFSGMAAPHFNALPRAFPDVKMVAINAMRYHLFNTQNGIVGVPTVLLFHNGRPIVKYNGSDYNLEIFVKFIKMFTGIEPEEGSVVISQDFAGPVVTFPSQETDMFLILSWLFIIICSCYYFSKSRVCKWTLETVQRYWRESEQHAQHEHMD